MGDKKERPFFYPIELWTICIAQFNFVSVVGFWYVASTCMNLKSLLGNLWL